MSALKFANKILLLRDGVIENFGPRDAVLAKLMPTPVPQAGSAAGEAAAPRVTDATTPIGAGASSS